MFPIYEEEIVKKAKKKNILIEIISSFVSSRPGSKDKCRKIAFCKEYNTNIVLNSDAHFAHSMVISMKLLKC